MSTAELPIVDVVGRPNVGKSTLVNRIVGKRVAIVEEKPGVTRDRKEVDAEWQGVPFRLIDTGGWMPGGSDLDAKVSRQSEQAIREADAVIVLLDAVTGVTGRTPGWPRWSASSPPPTSWWWSTRSTTPVGRA
jgi:GTP-binding protein